MRIAWVSPMPPERTGIADYSAALLPHLAGHLEVLDVYTNEASSNPGSFTNWHPIDELLRRWATYSMCVYQLGNSSDFHSKIYELAVRCPGVVVLHDYFLHHLIAGMTIGQGDFRTYLREFIYARGSAGATTAYRVARDQAPMPLFSESLSARLLDVAVGVIVHSRHALELTRAYRPQARSAYVPAPLGQEQPDQLSRTELGLPDDAFIVTIAGTPNSAKRSGTLLRAISTLVDDFPALYCAIVGDVLADADCSDLPGVRSRLVPVGFQPSLTRFLAYLQASDLIINLRYPSVGEASALALRAMALAKPIIVSDTGWYSELPSDTCTRLTHTGDEQMDARLLANLIAYAIGHPEAMHLQGRLGQQYVLKEHSVSRVAETYLGVIGSWLQELYGRS